MLNFRPIVLEDQEAVAPRLREKNFPGNAYTFANLFIWRKILSIEVGWEGGFLFLKSGKGEQTRFLPPIGNGDYRRAVEAAADWCRAAGVPLRFEWTSPNDQAVLKMFFPRRANAFVDRDHSDYLYSRERLATLSGKKLQSKRNFINRIQKENWVYETITQDNLAECLQMQLLWDEVQHCCKDASLRAENCAVQQAFSHYFALGLKGGCIRLDGRIVAYTMGEPLTADTFIVHIEKAFSDVPGAYPLINREFVRRETEGFAFINREDDAGEAGLRKAKLSYCPERILENVVVEIG